MGRMTYGQVRAMEAFAQNIASSSFVRAKLSSRPGGHQATNFIANRPSSSLIGASFSPSSLEGGECQRKRLLMSSGEFGVISAR